MLKEHYYFAYGSNMNSQRMIDRGLEFSQALAGQMHGYQLAFNKKAWDHPCRSYANVVVSRCSENSVVEGVLYKLNDHQQIFKMDPFEGAPRLYSRDIYLIETLEGKIPAWVYIANKATLAEGLKPDQWYLDHLLAGKPYLSESYYQRLTQVAVN
jgi:gamma-glutamylcyclotransferase (GGCT)/AIG2-like uncharacterized protein YtfP